MDYILSKERLVSIEYRSTGFSFAQRVIQRED